MRGRRYYRKSGGGLGVLAIIVFLCWLGITIWRFLEHHVVADVAFGMSIMGLGTWIIIASRVARRKRLAAEVGRTQRYKDQLVRRRQILLDAGIDQIDRMTGEQFEEKMALHFLRKGWEVTQTKRSGDFGADLILNTPDGYKVAAQLKRYANPVGINAVQQVIGSMSYYNAVGAMVITNSTLTSAAWELANKAHVLVMDRERLIYELATNSFGSHATSPSSTNTSYTT